MLDKIKIRKSNVTDLLPVYEQICILEDKVLNYNLFQKKFKHNISIKNIIYLTAINSKKEIVGFISCHIQELLHHDKKVAEIQEFIVKQKYRGNGIGRILIQKLFKILISKNCESIEVTAQNKRRLTHKFYSKNGFTQTHLKFIIKI